MANVISNKGINRGFRFDKKFNYTDIQNKNFTEKILFNIVKITFENNNL